MGDPAPGPSELNLDGLVHHIVEHHHAYVRDSAPRIARGLDVIVGLHGGQHPELAEVRQVFGTLRDVLGPHLAKEEHILFPFIEDLVTAVRAGLRPAAGPFGTLLNPIRVMESDHHHVASLMERLRMLTHGFAPPEDAGTEYRTCFEELARFDEDLARHIYLENDVLFPGAIALEGRLG